jgi:hypothetical protein
LAAKVRHSNYMFEGRRRLYIGDFSDPWTTAERKQMIPDYPTIEDFYRGRAVSGIVAAPKRRFWPIAAFRGKAAIGRFRG